MNFEREVRKCNELLKTLGTNPYGEPLYKWIFCNELTHQRFTGNEVAPHPDPTVKLFLPIPEYQTVLSYPHLKDRWAICHWQFSTPEEWARQFGRNLVWPARGSYYPTDLIVRRGKYPSLAYTEMILQSIAASRLITAQQLDWQMLNEQEREDRAVANTIHDILDDTMTAFGNDPGKRSGGVSFPSAHAPAV